MSDSALEPGIDVAKALKLRLVNRLSFQEIGTQFGVSAQAIQQRLARFTRWIADPEITTAYQEARSAILPAVEMELLHSLVDEECLAKASLNNRAYALTQVHTIRRLEEGKSTENVGILSKLVVNNDDGLFPKSTSYTPKPETPETCTILKTDPVKSTEIVSEQVEK